MSVFGRAAKCCISVGKFVGDFSSFCFYRGRREECPATLTGQYFDCSDLGRVSC